MEHVVDQVFPHGAMIAHLHPAALQRSLILCRRNVLLAWPFTTILFNGSGSPRSALNRLRIARPGRAKDADVVLAVAVPIADHRLIVASAELGPQIGGIHIGRCR